MKAKSIMKMPPRRSDSHSLRSNCVKLRKDIPLSARTSARTSKPYVLAEKLNAGRAMRGAQGHVRTYPPSFARTRAGMCAHACACTRLRTCVCRGGLYVLACPCAGLNLWSDNKISRKDIDSRSLRMSLRSAGGPCARKCEVIRNRHYGSAARCGTQPRKRLPAPFSAIK